MAFQLELSGNSRNLAQYWQFRYGVAPKAHLDKNILTVMHNINWHFKVYFNLFFWHLNTLSFISYCKNHCLVFLWLNKQNPTKQAEIWKPALNPRMRQKMVIKTCSTTKYMSHLHTTYKSIKQSFLNRNEWTDTAILPFLVNL